MAPAPPLAFPGIHVQPQQPAAAPGPAAAFPTTGLPPSAGWHFPEEMFPPTKTPQDAAAPSSAVAVAACLPGGGAMVPASEDRCVGLQEGPAGREPRPRLSLGEASGGCGGGDGLGVADVADFLGEAELLQALLD